MNKKQVSAVVTGILIIAIAALVSYTQTAHATASETGGLPWHPYRLYTAEVLFVANSDTSVKAELPEWGPPSGMFAWSWLDYDTVGKAKAAYAAGEAPYAVVDEYVDYAGDEYAGSRAGAISIYRGDLDPNHSNTLQTSVYAEVTFYYLPDSPRY